ncbi:MAG: hypothetical protein RLZZ436_2098 [Planctomycetota bacterium]
MLLPGLLMPLHAVVRGQEVSSAAAGDGAVSGGALRSGDGAVGAAISGDGGQAVAGADVLLRTADGRLIPLRDVLGGEAVSLLLSRAGDQQLPGYWIARLELRGKVTGEVLDLDVELQVVVRASSEWVSVPLAFGDVYLTDFGHESAVAGAESVLQVGDQNQRRWSLRGAGLHRLKFHLAGRARTAGPGVFQVNLLLPESAASHALLEFSRPVELQKLPAGAVDRQTRDERGVRQVEFVGISGAATLAWTEVSPPVLVKPVVQVQNRMILDLTTIPASLTGTLQLQITGSPLSEVRVAWPEGFVVNEVQARNASGASVLNSFELNRESGDREALIRLTGAVEGALTLEYDVERSNRSFPQDIRVSLPLVEDANVQTGDVELIFPAGMLVRQGEIRGAQRRRVTAEADGGAAATAFRLRSGESFIDLHVEEMEAQYAVTTELGIRPQGESVLLTGQIRLNVLRGALPELLLDWTAAVEGSEWSAWSLLPGGARLLRNGRSIPLTPEVTPGSPGTLKFVFPERQSGEFVVEFQAVTELSARGSGDELPETLRIEQSRLLLQCPQVQSRRGQPVVLRTEESDDYQAELLTASSGERLRGVPSTSVAAVGSSTGGVSAAPELERGVSWMHENSSAAVRIRLVHQPQMIRAAVTAGLQAAARGVEVRESIELDVMHREINEITLMVPESVQPVVRLAGVGEPLRAVIGKSNEWTFRLPQPIRGTLVLDVRWLQAPGQRENLVSGAAGARAEEDLSIDLVVPQGARIWRVLAGTSESGLEVREGTGWEPVYSEMYTAAWRNANWIGESARDGVKDSTVAAGTGVGSGVDGPGEADSGASVGGDSAAGKLRVPLRYRRGALGGVGLGPVLTLAESRLFSGQCLTSCRWYFERRPERLELEVPEGLSLESIILGGESLSGRSGVLQAQRDSEDRLVKWEILPEVLAGLEYSEGRPIVLEVRVRQELRNSAGLRGIGEQLCPRSILRVRLRGETSAATLVWLLRPQSGLSAVTAVEPLASMSSLPARVFGSDAGARAVSRRQLEAILSAFPAAIREAAVECGGEWLMESGGHDLCLGSGEDLQVRVSLVPQSLQLLTMATICLLVFVILAWMVRLPLGLPIPVAAAALTAVWVAFPDWAALMTPWTAAGVFAGVAAAGVQRWTMLQRYGAASLRKVTERPTVFGFPDYADSGLRSLRGVSGGATGGQSEAAAG